MKNKHYCCVYSCLNNDKDNSELGFFNLPPDRHRYNIWLKKIGREDILNKGTKINSFKVCEIHFNKSLIYVSTLGKNKRKFLKRSAIPTLNLPNETSAKKKSTETMSTENAAKEEPTENVSNEDSPAENVSTANISSVFITAPNNVGDYCVIDQKPIFIEDPVNIPLEATTQMEVDIEVKPDIATITNKVDQNNTPISEKVVQLHVTQTQLIDIEPAIVMKDIKQTQTPVALLKNTPTEKKLKQELYEVKKELKKAQMLSLSNGNTHHNKPLAQKTFLKLCDKFLNKNLADLVKIQSQLKDSSSGNRYDNDFKYFCLNLYYNNQASYERLQDTFCLPCSRTLIRLKMPLTSEMNEDVIRTLKAKVNHMTDKQNYCTICIGTIGVKANLYYDINYDKLVGLHEIEGAQVPEPATHTIYVIARGILEDWKQPITYALLGKNKNDEAIQKWIINIIEKLFDIGLNVKALVTDLDSDYLKQQITAENPFFYVNEKKIYYIFDPPHLLKDVRDNFMLYNFQFEGLVAKWEHVLQYYNIDKRKSLRLTPKLTDIHMKPNNTEKIKIEIAAQVLSQSVAAAISTYVDCNVIDMSAMGTVKFINLMNNIFDVFNSDTLIAKYEYKMAFSGEPSQIKFLYDMITFFNGLRLLDHNGYDVTYNGKFIEAFKITILSVLLLHEDLKTEKHPHLLTRRLNLDCIEEILVRIRKQNIVQFKTETPPTCKQLILFLRREFITNLKLSDEGSNNDLDNFLTQAKYLGNMRKSNEQDDMTASEQSLENNHSKSLVKLNDYLDIQLPEQNKLPFTAKYLMEKALKHHNDCDQMKKYVEDSKALAPKEFLAFVKAMDANFLSYFNCKILKGELISELLKLYENIPFNHAPCEHFPLRYIKELFIRLKLNYTVKENNRIFKKYKNKNKERFILTSFS